MDASISRSAGLTGEQPVKHLLKIAQLFHT